MNVLFMFRGRFCFYVYTFTFIEIIETFRIEDENDDEYEI